MGKNAPFLAPLSTLSAFSDIECVITIKIEYKKKSK